MGIRRRANCGRGRLLRSVLDERAKTRWIRQLPGFRQVARPRLYGHVPVGCAQVVRISEERSRRVVRLQDDRVHHVRNFSGKTRFARIPERVRVLVHFRRGAKPLLAELCTEQRPRHFLASCSDRAETWSRVGTTRRSVSR